MKARFENTYRRLPESFYSKALPRKVSRPRLVHWNQALADFLGIETSDDAERAEIFAGNRLPEGADPIAQAYAGHQFAHFVPRLGDGRAILLGELRAGDGKLYDLQLKGPGPTPYSRAGDGLAAIGPVLREYLVSEFMHRVGVPTTRALAVCTTGEPVYRDEVLPGAVLTRVAASHVRVGTFQYFYAQEDREGLERLLAFSAERHYPRLARDADLPLQFLAAALRTQADLVARWMAFGFIHGVMNTDNSSVGGLTIDYGPCAFMDTFRADQVYSSIDRQGRYAYANQPRIAHWNLVRLAECLAPLCPGEPEAVVESVNRTLSEFPVVFEQAWCLRMGRKLGLRDPSVGDRELIVAWLEYLQSADLDFTLAFRRLPELLESPRSKFFPDAPELERFVSSWRGRVGTVDEVREETRKVNPVYIPRNHLVERAIRGANADDFRFFHELRAALEDPFTERPGLEVFATPPRPSEIVEKTFCGT